ncbi:hypothetical protein Hamer_G007333 [Homarus americanus]|uniref:Uncharacterized protein n=1 Tax=Homarus americanus TaxID=6706 RepID=A0A8J5MV18_HOMAM|nr:hypothetical protein Hamer_G007333 [Homarus americanus]
MQVRDGNGDRFYSRRPRAFLSRFGRRPSTEDEDAARRATKTLVNCGRRYRRTCEEDTAEYGKNTLVDAEEDACRYCIATYVLCQSSLNVLKTKLICKIDARFVCVE